MDPRDTKLARLLVEYSLALQPGENVLIEMYDAAVPLVAAVIKEIYRVGGRPFLQTWHSTLLRSWLRETTPEIMKEAASFEVARMRRMQAYLGIRASANVSELGDVPGEKMRLYDEHYLKAINDIRVPDTKWCVLRYPTPALAQLAEMSMEAFTDFYYRVCSLDYAKMSTAMDVLVAAMMQTDRVRILGPGTDLSFSINGIPAVKCDGKINIPDGEVFTAPVRDSINGTITYNTPAEREGFTYTDIRLSFKDGRIVKAEANDSDRLRHVLDTDEGARYIGEFALGVNPYIRKPMKEALFDEKIMGSFHLTPGLAYKEADNGNRSAVHWDLVVIQTPEYGGGEIYFDDALIRKDGRFLGGLEVLNPENLE